MPADLSLPESGPFLFAMPDGSLAHREMERSMFRNDERGGLVDQHGTALPEWANGRTVGTAASGPDT
jgi:hypothetical protein